MAAVAAAAATATSGPASAAGRTTTKPVVVHLLSKGIGTLPARYLGLSFESGKTVNTGQLDAEGNLVALLKDLGTGNLRFGGASVDDNYPGASKSALAGLSRLVRATGWNVIYSVNLGQFNAAKVTADSHAVATALGPYLADLACGNEPDDYVNHHVRPASYTEADYLVEAKTCIKAVRAGAPKVPIAGPDTFKLPWLPSYAAAEKGTISLLAHHYYPFSNCRKKNVTATDLLSRATATVEAATLATAEAAARTAGVPFRLDETNSASCSGIKGISDTYASALWAIDFLLLGAQQGVAGMNFHGSLTGSCQRYTPLCLVSGHEYQAEPVFYGMAFTHLLGTGTLIPVSMGKDSGLAGHAIRSASGTVRIMIENLSASAVTVALHAGKVAGPATVLALTGPSLSATSGERIEGAIVKADGTLRPGPPTGVVCAHGLCSVRLAAYSAAIITLPGHPR
jgi:hypothetical protein